MCGGSGHAARMAYIQQETQKINDRRAARAAGNKPTKGTKTGVTEAPTAASTETSAATPAPTPGPMRDVETFYTPGGNGGGGGGGGRPTFLTGGFAPTATLTDAVTKGKTLLGQ